MKAAAEAAAELPAGRRRSEWGRRLAGRNAGDSPALGGGEGKAAAETAAERPAGRRRPGWGRRLAGRIAGASPAALRPYSDPYLTGVALGLILLAAFALAGRGLGASGAFVTTAANAVAAVSPQTASASPLLARSTGSDWLLFELAGVLLGGFLSALLAGRLRMKVERGPRLARNPRLALAFGGGALMGLGAVLARGCTSGLALSGGALLSVGSWMFTAAAFTVAYAVAPFLRRAWR